MPSTSSEKQQSMFGCNIPSFSNKSSLNSAFLNKEEDDDDDIIFLKSIKPSDQSYNVSLTYNIFIFFEIIF